MTNALLLLLLLLLSSSSSSSSQLLAGVDHKAQDVIQVPQMSNSSFY
jgi:hypothetical protein